MIQIPDSIDPLPLGFKKIPDGVLERAFGEVEAALAPGVAVDRLRAYYDPRGKYAGATFVEALAGPGLAPNDFTATDLFSVTLLSVNPPKPRPTRAFLDPGPTRNHLLALLSALGEANDLALADQETLIAMDALFDAVMHTLGRKPWVTASKLCARKRPGLFPVRDRLTCALLGLLPYGSYQIDWQVFRLVMKPESGVVAALHELRQDATDGKSRDEVSMDAYPLRWLDVLLWMRAKSG